ncbi:MULTISPECIES: hypothetical protein [unclassified Novosphingobium]|uniref:hypothetical protein n=1 Tax=unclassified Novosphingobium TaxID=2644732 RepID=UPI00146A5A58|nr:MULTISPECIES: hypothetical protein [unclassified Novosphingobium]NMN06085.1 hypothetical protein [Novosphingobium sp. SG919]NMN88382.1 hypothetical protein [Novosphingobium sp. SG916]
MLPFPYPFWPIWLFSLAAAASIVLARLANRIVPGPGHRPIWRHVWRECLALPAFATLATIAAMQQGAAPLASPLIAMLLALAGFRRVARAAVCYILRK